VSLGGVVLAGGNSRRMGRPKAWLPGPDGRPLIERALAALEQAGAAPLMVSCVDPGPFAALGAAPVIDRRPGAGPLAGLEAALHGATVPWLLVVACDMPHLDPAVLRVLVGRAAGCAADAVLPVVGGELQPFPGVYHRRLAPVVTAALDEGRARLMAFARSLNAEQVELPPGPSFDNVNTPEDLKRAGLEGA
jgi:molybdopterin-guanine dinucleotide biosynthesis protein A